MFSPITVCFEIICVRCTHLHCQDIIDVKLPARSSSADLHTEEEEDGENKNIRLAMGRKTETDRSFDIHMHDVPISLELIARLNKRKDEDEPGTWSLVCQNG